MAWLLDTHDGIQQLANSCERIHQRDRLIQSGDISEWLAGTARTSQGKKRGRPPKDPAKPRTQPACEPNDYRITAELLANLFQVSYAWLHLGLADNNWPEPLSDLVMDRRRAVIALASVHLYHMAFTGRISDAFRYAGALSGTSPAGSECAEGQWLIVEDRERWIALAEAVPWLNDDDRACCARYFADMVQGRRDPASDRILTIDLLPRYEDCLRAASDIARRWVRSQGAVDMAGRADLLGERATTRQFAAALLHYLGPADSGPIMQRRTSFPTRLVMDGDSAVPAHRTGA